MTMVTMKRLRLIAPSLIKGKLLRDLARAGCVEIENGKKEMAESGLFQETEEAPSITAHELAEVSGALSTLKRYAEIKKSLMTPKPAISESELYATKNKEQALEIATKINSCAKSISALHSEENRLASKRLSLEPWQTLDVPLELTKGRNFIHTLGTAPASVSFDDLKIVLSDVAEAELYLVSTDKLQHYLSLLAHKDASEAAMTLLKESGFSPVVFKDTEGTAARNIEKIDTRIESIANQRQSMIETITGFKDQHLILEQAYDMLTNEANRERLSQSLSKTKKTVYMEGWLPDYCIDEVSQILEKNGCAYEFADPTEDEIPPVYLKNSKIVDPFGSITELYGLPAYGSIIDPNPFVAVFFFLFFGLMLSDAAYGLILAIACGIFISKAKPIGNMARFVKVAMYVGISATIWGALFGSWFGNIVPSVSTMITGNAVDVPRLFDPLGEPMTMLIMSLAFGVLHLFVGMGLAAYRMIKQGHLWDAVCDIFFWYMIIIGLIGALVGIKFLLYVAVVGALGVLLTGGRHKKGLGKITGGLGSLYNITSYLSDILSYSRLMALGLATGVVAQVMNTMGSLAGNGLVGWALFILVFLIGQTFNLAISLLGAFVHTCRLQFVEFFGKFFEGGGRPFAPLANKTKFVQLLKEEN